MKNQGLLQIFLQQPFAYFTMLYSQYWQVNKSYVISLCVVNFFELEGHLSFCRAKR